MEVTCLIIKKLETIKRKLFRKHETVVSSLWI